MMSKVDTHNANFWSKELADRLYGVSRWGGGYFQIGDNGNMHVLPDKTQPDLKIDLGSLIKEIKAESIQFPVVVRFHDVLRSQVIKLNETFNEVISEAGYQNQYKGVYPIKVNQMREVVEEIVDAGAPYNFGLEAGSKPELLTVLAYNTNPNSLTILNGYKDDEFIRLALLGRKLGREIIIVVEKFSELERVVYWSQTLDVEPIIGIRTKMQVVGQGKWQSSSGERAKFGLSISEVIKATEFLRAQNMQHTLKLLHFHIGSQLPDIRAIKEAVNESARIYAELYKMGFGMQYVDVGGGLGIDYDGSQSTNDSSINYSLREYVADVVYGLREMCDLENVPHPTIVSESGRAITAHHSCVITEVVGEITSYTSDIELSQTNNEHILLSNMRDLYENLSDLSNFHEAYNDATQWKEQAQQAFKLRVVNLREMAKIEALYWQIMQKVYVYFSRQDFIPDDIQDIQVKLSSQYLCNFSVFQSAVDSWAIDQMLPVVPITQMNKPATKKCSLADITCDSDGKIDKFFVDHKVSGVIPLPEFEPGQAYYLGIFLTGAYQDVMGDMHNLFGRLNEVHVFSYDDDPEDYYIEEIIKGASVEQVLSIMQYHPSAMALDIKKMIDQQVAKGKIPPREGVKWTDFYERCLQGYTYLRTDM